MTLQTDKDNNIQQAKTNGNITNRLGSRLRKEIMPAMKPEVPGNAATGKKAKPPKFFKGEQKNELQIERDSFLHTLELRMMT
jgi:hypothetical protein